MRLHILVALIFSPFLLIAQEAPQADTPSPEAVEVTEGEAAQESTEQTIPTQAPLRKPRETTLEDDGTRVSVLGYHVFSANEPATEMRIPTDKFRAQMQRIKDSGIPVIDLDKFLKWRRGETTLPPHCILITLDDGWKAVYTEAYPIFKEFEFPFTVYLYQQYVDGGGRALTTEMINEMLSSGLCTIGNHSYSHPFPATVRKHVREGGEAYETFLKRELGTSKKFLEAKFGKPVTTYAYPGGFHTPEMHLLADDLGYECLFTVIPGKVSRDSPIHTLNRYIVLGNHDQAFEAALTFRPAGGGAGVAGQPNYIPPTTPHPVTPLPGALIESRLPVVSADLSQIENLDPDSIVMRVGGFGKVPVEFDPETKIASWKVNRPLRQPNCQASVQWKLKGASRHESPMTWSFRIDPTPVYLIK